MEILPKHYYKAEHVGGLGKDDAYILEQLAEINFKQKENACIAYSKIFIEQGRSIANTRLREYVNKCKSKNNGRFVQLNTI